MSLFCDGSANCRARGALPKLNIIFRKFAIKQLHLDLAAHQQIRFKCYGERHNCLDAVRCSMFADTNSKSELRRSSVGIFLITCPPLFTPDLNASLEDWRERLWPTPYATHTWARLVVAPLAIPVSLRPPEPPSLQSVLETGLGSCEAWVHYSSPESDCQTGSVNPAKAWTGQTYLPARLVQQFGEIPPRGTECLNCDNLVLAVHGSRPI